MQVLLLILIFISNISCKIIMVIDIFRHGARAPHLVTPPYNFGSEWDIGSGELTSLGERQLYLLGQKRRAQYIEAEGVLPDIYTSGTVYAEATFFNRSVMSGYAYLMGLYPLDKREQIRVNPNGEHNVFEELDDKIITRPVPLHSFTKERGIVNGHNPHG